MRFPRPFDDEDESEDEDDKGRFTPMPTNSPRSDYQLPLVRALGKPREQPYNKYWLVTADRHAAFTVSVFTRGECVCGLKSPCRPVKTSTSRAPQSTAAS